MQCPSCGSPFDRTARFARLAVCNSCNSAVILDKESLRVAGKMATLMESEGPLYVGATGSLTSRSGRVDSFRVEGRVRYRYEQGFWDEWYLDGSNGIFWVAEDGGDITISRATERKIPEGFYQRAAPGQRLSLGDRSYQVAERGVALCEGGEGMLPFELLSGEQVPFVDLEGASNAVATVEIDDDRARIYTGWRVEPSILSVDLPKPSPPEAAGAVVVSCFRCAAPLPEEIKSTGVVTCEYCGAKNDLAHDRLTCPSCTTRFELLDSRGVEMAVCPSCSQQIDLRGATPALLGHLAGSRPRVPLELGQLGTLRGEQWVVTGHIRFQSEDAWGVYNSDEFMLYSSSAGYRWLILEDEHFSLAEKLHGPGPDIPSARKSAFRFNGKTFASFETMVQRVTWVDGQLPYVATVGDESRYYDAICPPFLLSQEVTEREHEYFLSEYISAKEVAEGFGIEDRTEFQREVGSNQPYRVSPFRRSAKRIAGAFAVVNLALVLWAFAGVTTTRFSSDFDRANGDETLSDAFKLERTSTVYEARFDAPVSNSWVYVEAALLNERNEVVAEFGGPIEYYSGVEGGERWAEGSTYYRTNFRVDEPGAYRLLARAEGAPNAPDNFKVHISEGIRLARYNLILFFVTAAWTALEFMRRHRFEARRWGDMEED